MYYILLFPIYLYGKRAPSRESWREKTSHFRYLWLSFGDIKNIYTDDDNIPKSTYA